MPNAICLLQRKIEKLMSEHFPFNKLTQIPNDLFWCGFLYNESGIYLLFKKRNIIYIGLSSNLGLRLNAHFHDSKYGKKITSVGIIRMNYKDWYDCATIEASLINKFNPPYNKKNHYLNCRLIPSDFNLDEMIVQVEKELGIK